MPYAIVRSKNPLANRAIEASFRQLGLQVERFSFRMPKVGSLRLTTREYITGEDQGSSGGGTITVDEGMQDVLFFVQREENSLSFAFSVGGATVGAGDASLGSRSARTQGWIAPDRLRVGEPTPIYMVAANSDSIEGATGSENVEELAAKYDFLVVAFLEVK